MGLRDTKNHRSGISVECGEVASVERRGSQSWGSRRIRLPSRIARVSGLSVGTSWGCVLGCALSAGRESCEQTCWGAGGRCGCIVGVPAGSSGSGIRDVLVAMRVVAEGTSWLVVSSGGRSFWGTFFGGESVCGFCNCRSSGGSSEEWCWDLGSEAGVAVNGMVRGSAPACGRAVVTVPVSGCGSGGDCDCVGVVVDGSSGDF